MDAIARIILGLECDARNEEAASAHRAFDKGLADAENELGAGFAAHARALAELLGSHNLHRDAVGVLLRATKSADPEPWRTACVLGHALCSAGDAEQAVAVMRKTLAESEGTAHAHVVRAAFAQVAMRLGLYDDAIALYRVLARDEHSLEARREAALQCAIATRNSGDEPATRAELAALLESLKQAGHLATAFGARVSDELINLYLVAEDDAAIPIQEALVLAVEKAHGATSRVALQERANLSVALRAVGRQSEADALVAELGELTKTQEGLSFDRQRPHLIPLI